MKKQKKSNEKKLSERYPFFDYVLKWLILSLLVGVLAGSASALFLHSLDWATSTRESNYWIISLLPIAGLIIGFSYYYLGKEAVKGNNLLIEEYNQPKKVIPLIMAPLVYLGTILTHLFGGSAGREGTALQMGGSIADQFTNVFKLTNEDRKYLILIGISAGFASVFGTPWAGAIFALEVLRVGKKALLSIFPALLTAFIAHYVCLVWDVKHTGYIISTVPKLTLINLLWIIVTGVIFGVTAFAFSKTTRFWSDLFKKIKYPPLRPFIGGIIIVSAVYLIGTTKYIGLGVPTIVEAFHNNMESYDFLLKILFTSFTLGAGFKGGEVTPLFFIGATLGNILVWFVPLPIGLLAGMGFVAVFAGATNTPIACTIMGIELFGPEAGIYLAISCFIAFMFSGNKGIYSSQVLKGKWRFLRIGR